jgi:hypothetical protein
MSDEKLPISTPKYCCEKCNVTCSKLSDWNRHISTAKHKKLTISDETDSKVSANYACTNCEYICNKKSLWAKHILTTKHKKLSSETVPVGYLCEICSKNYSCYSSLWSHKQKCKQITNENLDLRNFIVEQTKLYASNMNVENKELRNFIIEQSKQHVAIINDIVEKNNEKMSKIIETCKPINNNTTINNNNNNNQKFNINLFLNETCKDAINFSDFVKNIQFSYEDLENNSQLGFVNGISKIFLDNLKQLDVNERPIHCTDVKRETMYIKDENIWTKQPDDEKLQKAIQTVSYRSMGKLAEWKQENPEYKDCNSEFSQKCLDIQRQTLAGSERGVYYPKVIHALARETIVDK